MKRLVQFAREHVIAILVAGQLLTTALLLWHLAMM